MAEMIDIYTEQGVKIGTISKREYYSMQGDVPWINCCTCFVIDEETNKICLFFDSNLISISAIL